MQIKYLHPVIYKSYDTFKSIELLDKETKEKQRILCNWDKLKEKGLKDKECQEITGISRATYYRRKKALKIYGIKGLKKRSSRPKQMRKSEISEEIRSFILKIRKDSPTYGKAKIVIILRRDYNINLSESSVGRVLKVFINKGIIQKYAASLKFRRKRKFNKHAKRWGFEKAKEFGDLIQID